MPKKIEHMRQGVWVEALFVARATARGLNVAKPVNPASRYDFLVEHGGRTLRVQVKSCSYRKRGYYNCLYRSLNSRSYSSDEFDFVAIYVVPEDLWYVIPMHALTRGGRRITSMIVLSPDLPNSKYHLYKEAWSLLRSRSRKIPRLEASADQSESVWRATVVPGSCPAGPFWGAAVS